MSRKPNPFLLRCDVSACCDPGPTPGGRINNHPVQGVKKDTNSWANITGFEQVFLLLVMYNAIRWHEHGQIVGSHFETRQPASPPSKRSDEPWVATIEVQLIKKNLPSWFADRSPCGRWSAYWKIWKKVCPMKTRAEFPIATVDYKRVSMSLSENGRQHPAHGSHDHPFPHQEKTQSSPPCPWPSLPSQHEQQSIAPGRMLIWWLSETINIIGIIGGYHDHYLCPS